MSRNVIACSTKWFLEAEKSVEFQKHDYIFITDKDELTFDHLIGIRPRYIFFPHWSWLVPPKITESFECVCFHSTPLPYGRGGSPIQNMIERGHKDTMLTAFRMTAGLDDGPIYYQRSLSLAGSADEIFKRLSALIQEMIPEIIETSPQPVAQKGEPYFFKRRTPAQSEVPKSDSLEKVYDHIRMLDADGYPKAFIEYGGLRLEFDQARLESDSLAARVVFKRAKCE